MDSAEAPRTLKRHKGSVKCVVTLGNDRIVSGYNDATLCIWDANTGICLAAFSMLQMEVADMDFSSARLDSELAATLYFNGAKIPEKERNSIRKRLKRNLTNRGKGNR